MQINGALVGEGFEAEIAVIAADPAAIHAAERELVFQIVRKYAVDSDAAG